MEPVFSLLSPKAAARALGVSEASVKRWCDRGLLESTRTVGGHRKISTGEIVHFARVHGSLLAAPEQLALTFSHSTAEATSPDSALRFAEQLLAGDVLAARQTLFDRYLGGQPLSVLFDEVISIAFRIIGERWSRSLADIYQERRACHIVLSLFQELKQYLRAGLSGRLAIGGTVFGDDYEIPSAMAELVLRADRYQTQNLGTSVPFQSLANAVRDLKPQLFWLSVSHIGDEDDFVNDFADFNSVCVGCGTALVVGGRALTDAVRPRLVYTAYCDTMQQLATFTAHFRPPKSASQSRTQGLPPDIRVPNAMRRTNRKGTNKGRPPAT